MNLSRIFTQSGDLGESVSDIVSQMYLTREDFDKYRNDPIKLVSKATELMNVIAQQINTQRERNISLRDTHTEVCRTDITDSALLSMSVDSANAAKEQEEAAARAATLTESIAAAQSVVDVLRADKEILLDQLTHNKLEQSSHITEHQRLRLSEQEWAGVKASKEALLREQDEELRTRINACTTASQRTLQLSEELASLQRELDSLATAKLNADTTTATLAHTVDLEKQMIATLQRELSARDQQLSSLEESTRHISSSMSNAIAEARRRCASTVSDTDAALSAAERAKTESQRQSAGLVSELKETVAELVRARSEFVTEVSEARHHEVLLRERVARLRSNNHVLNQRCLLLESDVKRIGQQCDAVCDVYSARESAARRDLNHASVAVTSHLASISSCHEDLQLLQKQWCSTCQSNVGAEIHRLIDTATHVEQPTSASQPDVITAN